MKNVLIFNKFLVTMIHTSTAHPGGGGGVTPDFKWQGWSNGGKNQTPKNSHAEFPSHKNFQRNYAAGIRGNYHESSDCLEYPKKSLLKSRYPKNTCGNFPNQNWKFQTPKNPSIITVTWNPEFPPSLGCLQPLESPSYSLVTQRSTFVWEKRCVTRQPHNH